jgi:hypothetical protein
MRRWGAVVAVIEDGHRYGDGNIAQQAEFGKVPVGAVAGDGTLGEDLRLLGVEERGKELLFLHRLHVRAVEAVT